MAVIRVFASGDETKVQSFVQRSCLTKVRHREKPPRRKWMKAYRCQFCKGWHYATKSNLIK